MFLPIPLKSRLELTRSLSVDSYFLKIRADKTDRRTYHYEKERALPQACLFVASLNAQKSSEQLQRSVYKAFEQFGPLLHVTVNRDPKQRPFAFVQFKYIRDADRAHEEGQHITIDDREIRIERAKVNRSLIVTRIASHLSYDQVWDMASTVGPIEELDYGQEIGEAFIKFSYREDALKACSWYKQFGWSAQWINQHSSYSVLISNIHLSAKDDLVKELRR
jgi:RNA recognition motif-containing protein